MTGAGRLGRIGRHELTALRSRLSERDIEILRAVERTRFLNARQVERVVFTEGSPLTRARRCRSALARLVTWGCLHRLERRVGGIRAGSAAGCFVLSPLGQRILHPNALDLARVREPSPRFVDHTLAVAELWVRLVEAEREGRLNLLEFTAEPRIRLDGSAWLKPDAHVVVATPDGWERHLWVEWDNDTEHRPVIARKAKQIAAAFEDGVEVDGVFPRTVFLVPDAQRLQTIGGVLRALPRGHWGLFAVATHAGAIQAICDPPPLGGRGP